MHHTSTSLLIVSLLVIPMKLSAQGATTAGPLFGINSTTLVGDDADGVDSRIGFTLGAQLQRGLSGGAFLRTGLQYSMRGAEDTEDGATATLKLDYVEIPVLVGYEFPTSGQTRPFAMVGAQLGLKAKCKVTGEDEGVSASVDCDEFDEDVSSTDLAFVLGGGISFPAGSGVVSTDLRFVNGLQKISEDADSKNRGFTLAVAYMLPIGSR